MPQGLTTLAWSVATWGECNFPLLDAIAAAARRRSRDFNPQDCFMTAWSWCVMSLLDSRDPTHTRTLHLVGCRFPAVMRAAVGVDWVEFANGVWSVWRLAARGSGAPERVGGALLSPFTEEMRRRHLAQASPAQASGSKHCDSSHGSAGCAGAHAPAPAVK